MLQKVITPVLFLLFWFMQIGSGYAQKSTQKFKHLTRDNGLSSNKVNCIIEDSQGFMWFGTEDGLNKYDGYKFHSYGNHQNNDGSLSDNSIDVILEDIKNNLWLATRKGVVYFDRIHQSFELVVSEVLNDEETGNINITSLCFDDQHKLWISTFTGLFIYDPETRNLKRLKYIHNNKSQDPKSNRIHCLYKDNSNVMWVGYNNGLLMFNKADSTFVSFLDEYNIKVVQTILQDSYNNYWVGSDNSGLYFIKGHPKNGVSRFFNKKNGDFVVNRVHGVIEDEPGKFYFIIRDGGLYYFDQDSDKLSFFGHDIYNPNSINSAAIISGYKSSDGIVWLGTYNSGINYVDRAEKKFYHYRVNFKKNGLFNNNIRVLFEDSEHYVWVGTKEGGGLSRFDRKTGAFKNYKQSNRKTGLTDDYIFAITELNKNELLIGTFRKGLALFNKQTEYFTYYTHNPANPKSLFDNRIYTLYKDQQNLIWVANYSNLQLFNVDKNEFTTIANIQRPRCFCDEDEDRIWVGSKEHGLYLYNKISGKYINYLHDADNLKSISSNDIIAVTKDLDGDLWIGTKNGLDKFDFKKEEFIHFTESDGLSSNRICGVLVDNSNNIWLSTGNGISKYNKQKATFKNYDVRDGLQGNEFEAYVTLKTYDNMLLFGGRNGFNMFHPDEITDNKRIPNIALTGFKLFNKELPIGINNSPLNMHIGFTDKIVLKYNQSAITFEYVALNYTSPEKNQYAYKLKGFDNEWIKAGIKTSAVYTNIPPGKYSFQVIGSNNDNYWNYEGASIQIIILNPLWRTIWAYFIYVLILIVLVYLIRKVLVFRIEQQNLLRMERFDKQRIQEVNRLKLRFFTNISHEFRTPLTLIAGPLNKLAGYKNDNPEQKYLFDIVQNNVRRLLKLVNELMDFRKAEHGQLSLRVAEADLVEFVQQVIDCFDEKAQQNQINLSFTYNTDGNSLFWFDKSVIDKIIVNLLSNAFKYTPTNGSIKVNLRVIDNHAELSVSDSGKGIPKDKLNDVFERFYQVDGEVNIQGTGIGLAFAKRIVEMHYGEINVDSEIGKGTTFTFTIPVHKNAFSENEIFKKVFVCDDEIKPEKTLAIEVFNHDKGHRSETLLIVEDNKDLREFLESHFCSFNVLSAENGKAGYQIANTKMPDLIISDIMMPELNGLDLCAKLKTHFATSHIPIILLTAKAEISQKTEGIEIGADAYIEKPFDIKYLNARVENLLLQRKVLRKRYANETDVELDDLVLNIHEKKFVDKTKSLIEKNMSNPDFSVETLGFELGLSRSQLFRKFKSIYELKPSEFIRNERLKHAKKLLVERNYNVNEISDLVGFKSASYFITSFKKYYGKTPLEFILKK
ncbi:MAG: ATP-binding protein [Salinivirgaceae bacterium]|jgi:signal transduction histidine kinase/ligand-binding sensor domain-containing protein/DNA-binding response OmpR family regulator|nr:ATP-binding protein [Salinivirgaceae bacterium]